MIGFGYEPIVTLICTLHQHIQKNSPAIRYFGICKMLKVRACNTQSEVDNSSSNLPGDST